MMYNDLLQENFCLNSSVRMMRYLVNRPHRHLQENLRLRKLRFDRLKFICGWVAQTVPSKTSCVDTRVG